MLFLPLIGLLSSVVGYVWCFSIVQNSTSTTGLVSWLCLEAGLSVMRLVIWAWNPTRDDGLYLDWTNMNINPFPLATKTTRKFCDPLIRARDFLKIIRISLASLSHSTTLTFLYIILWLGNAHPNRVYFGETWIVLVAMNRRGTNSENGFYISRFSTTRSVRYEFKPETTQTFLSKQLGEVLLYFHF